jgi:hypothetical protein
MTFKNLIKELIRKIFQEERIEREECFGKIEDN